MKHFVGWQSIIFKAVFSAFIVINFVLCIQIIQNQHMIMDALGIVR